MNSLQYLSYFSEVNAMSNTISLEAVKKAFAQLKNPVRLVQFVQEVGCERCPDALELVRTLKAQSNKIALEVYDVVMDRDKKEQYGIQYIPAIAVQGMNGRSVRFYGVPESLTLNVLLDCIVELSTGKTWFPEDIRTTLKHLERDVNIQVFIDTDCPQCPVVAETAARMALESEFVNTDIVVASDFPALIKQHEITTIPKTIFGANLHKDGHVSEAEFLEFIFRAEGLQTSKAKHCLVCGKPSPDVICTTCKTRIQAEAVEHKLRTEKGERHA